MREEGEKERGGLLNFKKRKKSLGFGFACCSFNFYTYCSENSNFLSVMATNSRI
jgi:hypothetical protein